ncbi:hypothetical protein [Protaetiibacter intestinalis]|uniref:Uncharacterized protein n=1 Tax=Protaetiibacter intestinalis TaxID=2419774 RepID=A0A387B5T6_9MICO|nr:hypothetical protein [Protaetiibacter intestinalis]AYF97081.1 hypothetical protein D7I47_01660 [Protaetiibacter intestinalis]
MMRSPRVASGLLGGALAVTLTACSAPAEPEPTPTVSREAASALRCLVDHSPWTLDLATVDEAWRAAIPADRPVLGGEVAGTATMSFASASGWRFRAHGVAFTLSLEDGAQESTTVTTDAAGDYAVSEAGDVLVLDGLDVDETRAATTTTPDGTRTDGVSIPAPEFPWTATDAAELSFTCTEHRLVISTPGVVPSGWSLSPG